MNRGWRHKIRILSGEETNSGTQGARWLGQAAAVIEGQTVASGTSDAASGLGCGSAEGGPFVPGLLSVPVTRSKLPVCCRFSFSYSIKTLNVRSGWTLHFPCDWELFNPLGFPSLRPAVSEEGPLTRSFDSHRVNQSTRPGGIVK